MKLLKFYTDCCSQCKMQTKILEGLEGIEVEPINCEEHPELVQEYQVRTLPTLVLLDDNGEFTKKMAGVTQLDVIKSIIGVEAKGQKWDM